MLREIYRQFAPPQPNPEVKGSAQAIEAGERACKGKTPLQVKQRFIDGSDLLDEQAALVYESSLPEDELAGYGYQGCIYSLAKGLEKRLAP